MSRYPVTDIGNLLQLCLALGVLLLDSHLLSEFCMTLSKENGCIARNSHRLQFLLLIGSLWIVDIVERGYLLLDARLHVEQTLMVHLAVHSRMPCCTLFHKLGKHTSMISLLPLFGHMVEDTLTLGLTLPIRDHLTLIGIDIFLRYSVTLQFTLIQRVQVLH